MKRLKGTCANGTCNSLYGGSEKTFISPSFMYRVTHKA